MKSNLLVLGATGKVGGETLRLLHQKPDVNAIAAVRSPAQTAEFAAAGIPNRQLDLDDPATLPTALRGIDQALLLTNYSVDMLKQSKRFIDEAKKQGVQHLVHLGASGAPTAEVAHWGWHQFVEAYIEQQGFSWTHLRPEAYMQNITGPGYRWLNDNVITHYIGDAVWSWVDCLDVAAVAAEALAHPEKHGNTIIPLGYDAKTMADVAKILSESSGESITARAETPERFYEVAIAGGADPAYMHCVYTQFKLDAAGKIPGAGTTFDNFEAIIGRPPTTWTAFAQRFAAETSPSS